MTVENAQTMDDIRFTSTSFMLCALAVVTEAIHEPRTWVASDVWNSGNLSPLHWVLAALSIASSLYWLVPPGLYGGVLAAPSLLLLPIVTLAAFAGLPHLLLWTLVLHHTPDVLLGLFRVALWRGRAASPAQQALAGLCLVSLLPLWFLTRVYWYSQLLSPSLLKPLPDSVVVVGLVVHVLLWILAAINLRHYWRLICYCWRYLAGDVEELGEVFDDSPMAAPTVSANGGPAQHRPRAHVSEHQKNMKLMYHTIMTMTRLKRKIRRRRAARAAAAAAEPGTSAEQSTGVQDEPDTGPPEPCS